MEDNAPYTVMPLTGERIDHKYVIRARARTNDDSIIFIHTEFDSILLLAKDRALPATLDFYRKECERLGASKEKIIGIDQLIRRIEKFQELNMEEIKFADELGE